MVTEMNRTSCNFDLIRDILIAIDEHSFDASYQNIQINGFDEKTISDHVYFAFHAGLIDARYLKQPGYIHWEPESLTSAGYDFLRVAEDETVWERAKKRANQNPVIATLSNLIQQIQYVSIEEIVFQ